MSHDILCFRCGASLAELSLPLSRQDECPKCGIHLHVCRMCRHYDRNVTRQCLEDGADDVIEKDRLNFCEWFEPSTNSFDATAKAEADTAKQALDALFGDGEAPKSSTDASDADDLFK